MSGQLSYNNSNLLFNNMYLLFLSVFVRSPIDFAARNPAVLNRTAIAFQLINPTCVCSDDRARASPAVLFELRTGVVS